MANQAQDIPLIVFYVENGEVSVIKKGEWDGGDIASLRQAVREALGQTGTKMCPCTVKVYVSIFLSLSYFYF